MALISPGLSLSVTDESQYVPGAVGSTPLLVLATAQDKTANGSYAAGTSKANAGKLQVFTSQRELVSALGYPVFKQTASGTPIHGSPLNEYGVMAAYSTLASANRLYAIRADIDLNELESTTLRPIGDPNDGTFWLDFAETSWGIYVWDKATKTFTEQAPLLITNESDMSFNYGRWEPAGFLGQVGDFAVILGQFTRLYQKDAGGQWRWVGSPNWQYRIAPSVIGSVSASTLEVTAGDVITINDTAVTFTGTTADSVVNDINAVFYTEDTDGVRAAIVDDRICLFVSKNSSSQGYDENGDPIEADGIVTLGGQYDEGTGFADIGWIASSTGIDYNAIAVHYGSYVDSPNWGDGTNEHPSGSIYFKTSAIGNGMNFSFKRYSSDSDSWTRLAAPAFPDEAEAIYSFDPIAGGFSTQQDTMYVRYIADDAEDGFLIRFFWKRSDGRMTRSTLIDDKVGGTFELMVTVPGQSGYASRTVSVLVNPNGSDDSNNRTFASNQDFAVAFVTAIMRSGLTDVNARVVGDQITLTHLSGGTIFVRDLTGRPCESAGISGDVLRVTSREGIDYVALSNYIDIYNSGFDVETSFVAPYKEPEDNTLWYYGDATQADIMINDGTQWRGYRKVTTDARGYNLSLTDPNGPIITPSKPKFQSDGQTPLKPGDLWLDTSDLENYPKLYRYNAQSQWTEIDNTDRVSQNGIIFADARWDASVDTDGNSIGGLIDPIGENYPEISEMLTSDYVDADAPNPRLYPRGTLLFNTRRSGFNVKKFVGDYFNEESFPEVDALPVIRSAWVSVSGLKDSGAPYMGVQAQRNMVVKAMRSALDGNTQVREDQFFFNLVAAPGYPELITNMVALNNDRKNTAFVIGDTPMTLPTNSIAVANWANNTNGDGLSTADPYMAVYYPAGLTNDVDGNTIVVPASHMMLRTFIRNDNVSYPWFAPAGTRRGLIDNATDIGYIDSRSGGFVRNGVNQGMRDALYENRVNPMTILPGVGLVAWGQKTRNPTASAMDRVNVARLVNYIRTILASVGNGFLFEPNDKITRDQIKSIIEGAMNDLVAKRGIYDYLVVCDSTNNTPDRVARNELYVDIAIEPMKAVEFIYIPIRLKNPGDIAKLG